MTPIEQIRAPITHELKCHPEPFQAVKRKDKWFEFRKDDRDYRVGDELRLREWDPAKPLGQYNPDWHRYTGDECHRVVTYIIREGFGIPEGYCIMSLSLLSSMEGQTKTESYREHAWEARGMNGHWWCLNCGICGGNGTAPANVGPCVDHGPVDTCSESPPVPCISVADAMEAFKEWCKNDMKNSPVEDGFESEWKFPDLLERLTKAAK